MSNKTLLNLMIVVSAFIAAVITYLISLAFDFSFSDVISELSYFAFDTLTKFLICFVLSFIVVGAALFILSKKKNWVKKEENLGSSDFAKEQEFEGITGSDGLIIGKKFRLSEKKSFEHVVCVGPTGSGKSASFFIPNLVSLPAASIVVSDPKGELFMKTARANLEQGKRVLVFSPFKNDTLKYNPLSLCRNSSEVRELAQTLLVNGNAAVEALTGTKAGGSEWTNMATPLLAAFLIYVQKLNPPQNTVSYALDLIINNDLETLQYIIEDSEPSAEKQFAIFMQSAQSEQTASSIKTVLSSNLQLFTDPMIETVTSHNEIEPLMLREKPTVLYVVVPEHKSSYMAPLMAPFYSQLMSHLVEDGNGCPVYFLLDEFANIGTIPNIDVALATVRSRKMSLALGIQSINQLKQRYGQETSVSILDNLKCKFVLPGLAFDSANYFSQLIGYKQIKTTSTSYDKKNNSSGTSDSFQKRELLTADEIRRLADETLLVVADNRNPFVDQQIRYYKDARMLAATEKEMDIDQYVKWYRDKIER